MIESINEMKVIGAGGKFVDPRYEWKFKLPFKMDVAHAVRGKKIYRREKEGLVDGFHSSEVAARDMLKDMLGGNVPSGVKLIQQPRVKRLSPQSKSMFSGPVPLSASPSRANQILSRIQKDSERSKKGVEDILRYSKAKALGHVA